jgi:DNA-binding transcriptional MerR regulator
MPITVQADGVSNPGRWSAAQAGVELAKECRKPTATRAATREPPHNFANCRRRVLDRPADFLVTDTGVIARRRQLAGLCLIDRRPENVPRLVRGRQCVDVRGHRCEVRGASGVHPGRPVRNYEDLGALPPAERTDSGYRCYTDLHARALRTFSALRAGYGHQASVDLMRSANRNDQAALYICRAASSAFFMDRNPDRVPPFSVVRPIHDGENSARASTVHGCNVVVCARPQVVRPAADSRRVARAGAVLRVSCRRSRDSTSVTKTSLRSDSGPPSTVTS